MKSKTDKKNKAIRKADADSAKKTAKKIITKT